MTEGSDNAVGYFLSYSRSDEAFALRLASEVRAEGIPLWVDQLDIRPSERWDRAIERAVSGCRGIVVIVSPRSIASDNVADEISYAIDAGKSVLPVMIERCNLPLRITRMQVIDATSNYQKALRQCIAELRRQGGDSPLLASPAAVDKPVDPQIIDKAKNRLADVLGPIANVLTEKTAARAKSAPELYRLLSLHIEDEAERERFLGGIEGTSGNGSPAAGNPPEARMAMAPAEIDKTTRILASYLGPIAAAVVKRELKSSGSLEELGQGVARLIPTSSERDEFLRKLLST